MINQNNERLNKVAASIAKIVEVFHWVAVGLLSASLVVYFVDERLLKYLMDIGGGEFAVWGYSIHVLDAGGSLIPAAFLTALIVGILVCGLVAMIFRNVYLVFKTAAGETKFSMGATPFQPANVRMLREIGFFAFSIPVVEFFCDTLVALFVDRDLIESGVSTMGLVFGILLLCLSQFFAYGTQLQNDSDGLV